MQNDTLLFINTNNFDSEVIKSALKGFEGVSGLRAQCCSFPHFYNNVINVSFYIFGA